MEVDGKHLKFKIDFTDPTAVSVDQLDLDVIIFKLLRPELFTGRESEKQVEALFGQENYSESTGFTRKLNGASKKSRGDEE